MLKRSVSVCVNINVNQSLQWLKVQPRYSQQTCPIMTRSHQRYCHPHRRTEVCVYVSQFICVDKKKDMMVPQSTCV